MTGPEGIIPKPPTLSEIIKSQKIYVDPGQFELVPNTAIKKHPSSGTHQGLDLDYKSISFATVLSSEQMMTYTEMFEQIFGKSEEQRLHREMAQASTQLPGRYNVARCPGCLAKVGGDTWGIPLNPLHSIIAHLNDDHRWNRNKIADWLDELADRGEIDIDFPTPQLKENE